MKRERVMLLSLAGLAVALALGALYLWGPHADWLPECLFHRLTGLACPGCGMTRATHAALHGRMGEAFRYNPVGMVVLPVLLIGVGVEAVGWVRGRPSFRGFWCGRWLWGILGLMLAFAVLRNIPVWPFSLLALP